MIDSTTTDIARSIGIAELCREWQQADKDIREAFAMIVSAQDRLQSLFGSDFRTLSVQKHSGYVNFADPGEALKELHRQVWVAIAGKLEIRTMLSLAKLKELDAQLASGAGLPPIEFGAVMATLEGILAQRADYLRDKVAECYRWLRPEGAWREKYVTNAKSLALGVGEKVILTYAVRRGYAANGAFEVNYGHTMDNLRALDQVFHLLDGQPQSTTYNGDLCEAIRAQTSRDSNCFKSKYFAGRCFQNGNLHLTFRRADLVDQFNLICGGNALKEPVH